jgi:anti-sigma regulatory factor (Ser/Thr protein kinase)
MLHRGGEIVVFVLTPGSPAYVRRIPTVTLRSPQTAREWTRTLLTGLGYSPDLAELAVSEFLANVLRYASGPAVIAVALTDEGIEVACFDRHPETADDVRPSDAADDALTGRGLWMLALLALDGVHVDTDPRRKRVAVRLPIGSAA